MFDLTKLEKDSQEQFKEIVLEVLRDFIDFKISQRVEGDEATRTVRGWKLKTKFQRFFPTSHENYNLISNTMKEKCQERKIALQFKTFPFSLTPETYFKFYELLEDIVKENSNND